MFLSLYYDTNFRKNKPAWAILALDFGLFRFPTALPPMLDYYSPTFSAAQVELFSICPFIFRSRDALYLIHLLTNG